MLVSSMQLTLSMRLITIPFDNVYFEFFKTEKFFIKSFLTSLLFLFLLAAKRINIMAEQSGAKIGNLKNSRLGVFQITAKNSGTSSYGYDGYLDTSSKDKTASITVRLEYDVKSSIF